VKKLKPKPTAVRAPTPEAPKAVTDPPQLSPDEIKKVLASHLVPLEKHAQAAMRPMPPGLDALDALALHRVRARADSDCAYTHGLIMGATLVARHLRAITAEEFADQIAAVKHIILHKA